MDSINKTLYIPLYGKAYVSRKGIILTDKKAEEIWQQEGFSLKGKSKSKWLAYYMAIRSAVFDSWTKQQLDGDRDAVVVHIGCGMDSRVLRVGNTGHSWYDVDFDSVISERKRYYTENENYHMVAADVRQQDWLENIPGAKSAVVVMEGVSMYMTAAEVQAVADMLADHFGQVSLLVDCYTVMAAKMSKYKNPINDVSVTQVYGIDNPKEFEGKNIVFVKEHDMTPDRFSDCLSGAEKLIFKKIYAGSFSKKLYRLYEYKSK